MWGAPASTSRRRRNPLDRPTWRKRLTTPGRTDFLEVFRKIACSEGLQPNPEYSNTQQGLPDYWYILSRLLNMQGFWLWSSFAEKPLVLDPYFNILAPISLINNNRFAWTANTHMVDHLTFSGNHSRKSYAHNSILIWSFTTMWQSDQGSHIRESRRIDPI